MICLQTLAVLRPRTGSLKCCSGHGRRVARGNPVRQLVWLPTVMSTPFVGLSTVAALAAWSQQWLPWQLGGVPKRGSTWAP